MNSNLWRDEKYFVADPTLFCPIMKFTVSKNATKKVINTSEENPGIIISNTVRRCMKMSVIKRYLLQRAFRKLTN